MQKVLAKRGFDILAILVLAAFFLISLPLIHNESVTSDELAHIPAAYDYDVLDDYTLNPEHPPLAKMIAGLGFLGTSFKYPTTFLHKNENTTDKEWAVGKAFLYHEGNNTASILFRSRIPILIASVIGLFISYLLLASISRRSIAFLTLFLTALSPTVIAHGHLVTTDVLVMNTITIAILCFIKFLKRPTKTLVIIAAISLVIAQLSKYSAALLLIFYPIATWIWLYAKQNGRTRKGIIRETIKMLYPIYILTAILIYFVYALEVIHLSSATQDAWIVNTVGPTTRLDTRILLDLNKIPLFPPIVRYVIGFSQSLVRVSVGGGANLLGKDYKNGVFWYFPVVAVLKTPTPILLLWAMMVTFLATKLTKIRLRFRLLKRLVIEQTKSQPLLVFSVLFFIIYFAAACIGRLDIGIRHLLPLFPLVSLISSVWIVDVLGKKFYHHLPIGKLIAASILGAFLIITLTVYPNYLPYTTELAGGAQDASYYYNDSNVDWGQSLLYLANYMDQHPQMFPLYTNNQYYDADTYYICHNVPCSKVIYITNLRSVPPGRYVAISEFDLTVDWTNPNGPFASLKNQRPVARIGDSMYLYQVR